MELPLGLQLLLAAGAFALAISIIVMFRTIANLEPDSFGIPRGTADVERIVIGADAAPDEAAAAAIAAA